MSALRKRVEANVPDQMRSLPRWLLWKQQRHPIKPKLRKVPHYADGRMRNGILDTPDDVARLVTMAEALTAYENGQDYAGLGFALVEGDGIVALDLDHCLDDARNIIDAHAGFDVANEAEIAGAYMERSPSGDGLRVIGTAQNSKPFSKNDVEAWGRARFVTITGDAYANARSWVSIEKVRAGLEPPENDRQDAPKPKATGDEEIITPEITDTLREALEAIDSENRELWVRMGLALKTLPNDKGFDLFMDWSAKALNFDRRDAISKWETFRPKNTHWKVVFSEAQSNWQWTNPKKGKKPVTPEGDDDTFRIDLGPRELRPTEFLLDGFMPTGVSVIAGAWGAGKTVNLAALLASVGHLAPEDWGFRPVIRRKVVWVSEAPEQTRDVLYSLSEAEGAASWDQIREWFILCRAQRREPEHLARIIKSLVAEARYSLDNGFLVNPVVVLDTSAANLELENESDNSEVSRAMAILKQSLPGVSIILVGHTPKALIRADVHEATFRGAGAWEADANATYALTFDPDTDRRHLAIRKCRFSPHYLEVEFDHEGGSQIIDTPWGIQQRKSYLHGVPTKSSGEARKMAKEAAREGRKTEAEAKALTDRQQRALDHIAESVAGNRLPTKTAIATALGGKRELAFNAIDRLIEAGALELHTPSKDQIKAATGATPKGPPPEVIFPSDANFDAFLARLVEGNQ